jgi:hypothetical protein
VLLILVDCLLEFLPTLSLLVLLAVTVDFLLIVSSSATDEISSVVNQAVAHGPLADVRHVDVSLPSLSCEGHYSLLLLHTSSRSVENRQHRENRG